MSLDRFTAKDSQGRMWAFELPKGEAPALGTTGWLLPFFSGGEKILLATGADPKGWYRSLKKAPN